MRFPFCNLALKLTNSVKGKLNSPYSNELRLFQTWTNTDLNLTIEKKPEISLEKSRVRLFTVRKTAYKRVAPYLGKMRRTARVNIQRMRAKILRQLDALFKLAFSIVKGEVLVNSRGEGSFQKRRGYASIRRKNRITNL